MRTDTRPFTIRFREAQGRDAIIDRENRFATYADFVLANKHDLNGAILEGINLSDVDLSGANLVGAVLAKSDLRRCNLSDANLSWADLSSATCVATNFSRARAQEVVLDSTNLSYARLHNADFRGCEGVETNMKATDLTGADFGFARFYRPCFDKAIFAVVARDNQDVYEWARHRINAEELWRSAAVHGGSYEAVGRGIPDVLVEDSRTSKSVAKALMGAMAGIALPALATGAVAAGAGVALVSAGTAAAFYREGGLDGLKSDTVGRAVGMISRSMEWVKKSLGALARSEKSMITALNTINMIYCRDQDSMSMLVKAFKSVGVRYQRDPKEMVKSFGETSHGKGRLFVCSASDLNSALAELAKQEKGFGYKTAVLVRAPSVFATSIEPDVPTVLRFDGSRMRAVWTLDKANVTVDYRSDGTIMTVKVSEDGKARVFKGEEIASLPFRFPPRDEVVVGFRRRVENGLYKSVSVEQAKARMKPPEGYVVQPTESGNGYVCYKVGEKTRHIDNPNGPAIVMIDGRELYFREGKQVPTPGVIQVGKARDGVEEVGISTIKR
jgi:hypothetical protein